VLKADVWREVLIKEERELNGKLNVLDSQGDEKRFEDEREEVLGRLAEIHQRLADIEAETGPARAAALLAGSFFFSQRSLLAELICSRSWI
jgi:ATP-binding cassette subfamily F protein 3